MKRIKVLFIHWKLVCGGAEKALFDLIGLMDKEKFEITVFTIHDGGEWEQKFRDAGIRVINSYSNLQNSSSPFVKIQNRILLSRVERARKNRGMHLLDVCTKEKWDLIVSYHTGEYCGQSGFQKGAKTIKYIHEDAKSSLSTSQQLGRMSAYLPDFDRIICVSELAKQSFISTCGIKDNVLACYNPIDSANILKLSQEPVEIPFDKPYLCAVGRLSPEKGFCRLVQVYKRCLDAGADCDLIIVGDGPERENLEKVISETGTQGHVILAGYQENPYPYIRNSLFTVCSSFSEGLHMASMESLCLGIPVVSAYPTINELFGSESCGIITENDDDSLYNGICKMMSDKVFYRICKRSAERRSPYFSRSNMVRKVEQIYTDLVNEK